MNNIDFPLDHEQTEKILQFQDLTGIEDIALCRDILQRHNWNLETTIQDQMSIKESRPSVYTIRRRSDKLLVLHNEPSVQQISVAESPSQPFRGRWTGTIGLIASFLFSLCNTFASFFEFARCFFWNRPRYRTYIINLAGSYPLYSVSGKSDLVIRQCCDALIKELKKFLPLFYQRITTLLITWSFLREMEYIVKESLAVLLAKLKKYKASEVESNEVFSNVNTAS